MASKKLYLPINPTGLAHYFSKALICPVKYFDNRPEDIQNTFSEFLLISDEIYLNNSECSLEIILTNEEQENIINIFPGIYLYSKPVPVTRVKKIYFKDEEKKKITLWDINNGAAFIPENLTEIKISEGKLVNLFNSPVIENPDKLWKDEIRTFNRYLGGFAFMRLGGESYMNYSENYFKTLSYFNAVIEKDFKKALKNSHLNTSAVIGESDSYIGAFTGDKSWIKLINIINSRIDDNVAENVAKERNIKVEKQLGLINFQNLNKDTIVYITAVLATYGEGKRKKTEDLILDLYNGKISEEKREGLALAYGLHYGYSCLRNYYNLNTGKKILKYKLTGKLDYYTIESIYQYIFNHKSNNSKFEYLDKWIPKKKIKPEKNEFLILDEIVIGKKKIQPGTDEHKAELMKIFKRTNDIESLIDRIFKDLKDYYENVKDFSLIEQEESDELESLVSEGKKKYGGKRNKKTADKPKTKKTKRKETRTNTQDKYDLFNQ